MVDDEQTTIWKIVVHHHLQSENRAHVVSLSNRIARNRNQEYQEAEVGPASWEISELAMEVGMILNEQSHLTTGWWFGCHFLFSHILGF